MRSFHALFIIVLTGLLLLSRLEAQVIIYDAAEGTVGTQEFGGSLGMDFEVNSEIIVTDLGASKLKDLGRCMSALKERYPGLIETGAAGKAVRKALSRAS